VLVLRKLGGRRGRRQLLQTTAEPEHHQHRITQAEAAGGDRPVEQRLADIDPVQDV